MGHPTPSALLLLLQGSEGSGCGGMARVMPGPGPPSAQHLRTERSWRRPPAGQATAPHASPETEGRSRGLPFSGFCVFEGRPGWCLFSLTPSVPRTLSVPTPLSACVRSRAGPSSGRLQATGNQTSTVTPPPNPLSQEAPHFTPPTSFHPQCSGLHEGPAPSFGFRKCSSQQTCREDVGCGGRIQQTHCRAFMMQN